MVPLPLNLMNSISPNILQGPSESSFVGLRQCNAAIKCQSGKFFGRIAVLLIRQGKLIYKVSHALSAKFNQLNKN